MIRLADYFCVVGYDIDKDSGNGVSQGKILQRFPEKDWSDTPFIEGIELFCQPHGWALSMTQQPPTFFVCVLTDIDANRHYCACLCFHEVIALTPTKTIDELEEPGEIISPLLLNQSFGSPPLAVLPNHGHHSLTYAPKCLVLVSRLYFPEAFRHCLGLLYTVHMEGMGLPLETLVGNLLACVQVPPAGGPQIRYSLGAGDKQALQPPLSPSLPVTATSVATLFDQLGIRNVVFLVCALMTEHKVLVHSASYSRLTEACHALTSLLFPFRYGHVYIPILPAPLLEVLSTPTPFLMGVHSDAAKHAAELLDVLVADLDGGAITVPEGTTVPLLAEPLYSQLINELGIVLHPELTQADWAFPPMASNPPKNPHALDKELRACVLRAWARFLQGYRTCLTLVRIHPKPVLTFHHARFLAGKCLMHCTFSHRVLHCMFFGSFVQERGPPWRRTDVFDELQNELDHWLRQEAEDPRVVLTHIKELADKLYHNEHPHPGGCVQKVPLPTEGAFTRIHQLPFPSLKSSVVADVMEQAKKHQNHAAILASVKGSTPRLVPPGPSLSPLQDTRVGFNNSARRLEVLKQCIGYIFEGRISDAKKSLPAALRALQSRGVRSALCTELRSHVQGNKAVLDSQQFDLVVRLMNCALQDDGLGDVEGSGVAAALLPLCTTFCRKLCPGVFQFACTCIQTHSVWQSLAFWEAAYYSGVQKGITALYSQSGQNIARTSISPLDVAAEQMRKWASLSPDEQKSACSSEESIVYSQAIHYVTIMFHLLLPLSAGVNTNSSSTGHNRFRLSQADQDTVSNSLAESSVSEAESGFEDTSGPGGVLSNDSPVVTAAVRLVNNFLDRVCTEGGVTAEHVRQLHSMVPGVASMHLETLESVAREARSLPPIQKAQLTTPFFLPGEKLVISDPLRVYLLADGREDVMVSSTYLPAQGALFLTSYRLIFKGTPCDPFACEKSVVRAFPVTSLTKEKRISVQYLSAMDQWLQEGWQLRSNTFQLLRVALDEEVSSETMEQFRKAVHRLKHPPSVLHYFALTGQESLPVTPLHKNKEKSATLRGITKKTLSRVGLKMMDKRPRFIMGTQSNGKSSARKSEDDNESGDEETINVPTVITTQHVSWETLCESSYVKDWIRVGLVSRSGSQGKESFRLTAANNHYALCRSYPAVLPCPFTVSDDSLRRVGRCYRSGRLPVPTWRHPRTQAVLVRSAALHGKGLMALLRPSSSATVTPHPASNDAPHSSIEQERLLAALVAATPRAFLLPNAWSMSDSTLSITSLMVTAGTLSGEAESRETLTLTPDLRRENAAEREHTKSRNSRWGSLKGRRHTTTTANTLSPTMGQSAQGSPKAVNALEPAALYVLGEKTQMRVMKSETYTKIEFVPIDIPEVRNVRNAFKKLMRTCVPSTVSQDQDHGFFRLLENSDWLTQLSTLLQVSGSVVDLLDIQGSSVLLCLEEGWDTTAQIVSLAQLCLDPYYRTLEGFRVLVEKEWLAFGHRFGHRSNLGPEPLTAGFTPIFLQFLDAVHQLLAQFPLAFQFNPFYLKFLAYHTVSVRFKTFLLDSEQERREAGWTPDGHVANSRRNSLSKPGMNSDRRTSNSVQSVFEYIQKECAKSTVFFNLYYCPSHLVLRPHCALSSLVLWDYYGSEELGHGPAYDLELAAGDIARDEEENLAMQSGTKLGEVRRRTITRGYDSFLQREADGYSAVLETIRRLEAELDLPTHNMTSVLEKLIVSSPTGDNEDGSVAAARSYARSVHKQQTVQLLLRGRAQCGGSHNPVNVATSTGMERGATLYSNPHRFEKHNYGTPSYCDLCGHVLWGIVKTGVRCVDCGYNCHERCIDAVPKHCPRHRDHSKDVGVKESDLSTSEFHSADNNRTFYPAFGSTQSNETRSHEGWLYKRGALLKGWKQRWFVLDLTQHQLRYYDSSEDSAPKGFLDLAEVVSVNFASPAPGAPKKTEEKAFFDVRTVRRTYNFCGLDASAAQEWVEKLQACLQ